jgi:hypothetical protein
MVHSSRRIRWNVRSVGGGCMAGRSTKAARHPGSLKTVQFVEIRGVVAFAKELARGARGAIDDTSPRYRRPCGHRPVPA